MLLEDAYSKQGFNISRVVFDGLLIQLNEKLFNTMTMGSENARMNVATVLFPCHNSRNIYQFYMI